MMRGLDNHITSDPYGQQDDLALFDIEPPPPPPLPPPGQVIARRPGHQLTIQSPFVTCQCGDRTKNGDYDRLVKWCYAHLGIAYDTAIDQAAHQ